MGDFVPKKKTQIDDIERTIYDITNEDRSAYKSASGLTEEIIRDISARKHDPAWMLDFRLKSLKVYHETPMPAWGPDLSVLNMDEIVTYVRPDAKMVGDWNEVPEDIKDTFDRLGIPEAEKSSLAGVGAQYDSEVVYHSIQESLVKQGVVYTDMETALQEYGNIVQQYFMTLVPPKAHKFAALHGAVWSGGSFVYVPEGIQVDIPLQSYFRLNAAGAGQFEHTLIIVEKGASLHFIEGCSAPKYNVTNLHAGCVELFVKEGARLRYSTIENWSRNMILDAPNTSANISTRSISKSGGAAIYRSGVKVTPRAVGAKCSVNCESLMLDSASRSDTLPVMDVACDTVDIGHEAKIGRISDEAIFYLMSRGIDEEEARAMIVRGFVEPIAKELPLEYAVEMNNLVNIELEGAMG